MNKISRREFLKFASFTAATLGLSQSVSEVAYALENAAKGQPPVIWIQGASCTGCSVSLLNSVHPDIKEILLEIISLKFHPNISAATGHVAVEAFLGEAEKNKGKFYLVVEGAVPTKDNGVYCSIGEKDGRELYFSEVVKELGEKAKAVIAIGTCAAYGGIPAADPNPTGCVPVSEVIDQKKVLNIPGCPPHPDWFVGSLAHVLLYNELPKTDKFGRPKMFYGGIIHDNCPRRQYFDNSIFAKDFSEPGCLLLLGCKGPVTHSDCPTRLWNGGVNWCIKAGHPCIGCTEPGFPDKIGPIYEKMPEVKLPGISASADTFGEVVGAATAIGLGAHLIGNIVTGRLGGHKKKKKEGEE